MEFFCFTSSEAGELFDWLSEVDEEIVNSLIETAFNAASEDDDNMRDFDTSIEVRSHLAIVFEAYVARESECYPLSEALVEP